MSCKRKEKEKNVCYDWRSRKSHEGGENVCYDCPKKDDDLYRLASLVLRVPPRESETRSFALIRGFDLLWSAICPLEIVALSCFTLLCFLLKALLVVLLCFDLLCVMLKALLRGFVLLWSALCPYESVAWWICPALLCFSSSWKRCLVVLCSDFHPLAWFAFDLPHVLCSDFHPLAWFAFALPHVLCYCLLISVSLRSLSCHQTWHQPPVTSFVSLFKKALLYFNLLYIPFKSFLCFPLLCLPSKT